MAWNRMVTHVEEVAFAMGDDDYEATITTVIREGAYDDIPERCYPDEEIDCAVDLYVLLDGVPWRVAPRDREYDYHAAVDVALRTRARRTTISPVAWEESDD